MIHYPQLPRCRPDRGDTTSSQDRIVTSHTGSLPRAKDLIDIMWAGGDGIPVQQDALSERVVRAVDEVVRRQLDCPDLAMGRQLDCPDLAMGRHSANADLGLAALGKRIQVNIEALNQAARCIPEEQLRMHLCSGNDPGPHHCDLPITDIIDLVWKAKPRTVLFEVANPRRAQEWALVEEIRGPDDKAICQGVIGPQSNYIEHPERVAQRILRYADRVGRERVMDGLIAASASTSACSASIRTWPGPS